MVNLKVSSVLFLLILSLYTAAAEDDCNSESPQMEDDKSLALKLKLIAIASILTAGFIGSSLPSLCKYFPVLSPESKLFLLIKAFSAGVILATGLVHVLPDANESLTSPCLKDEIWKDLPWAFIVAMASAIVTLAVEKVAVALAAAGESKKETTAAVVVNELDGMEEGRVQVHTHASHGHAHGSALLGQDQELRKHRITSKLLEMGIIVHSVIIGISLGASQSPNTIRPLVAALTFHQFFEGMGLGGCIAQAKFKSLAVILMVAFFSLTTPIGIGVGFGISKIYDENSPTALIVEGIFNATSAGILVYMSLVDLIATDFGDERMQKNVKLLMGACASLLAGAGCMSMLAIWA